MKKTTKQILKRVAKYGAVYGLGVATVVAVWWATYVSPERRAYALTVLYNIDTGSGIEKGDRTGATETAAMAYLYEPLHIFQRQKGVHILERQADKGLVSPMMRLARYYADIEDNEKFLYWARKAAKKGHYGTLVLGLLESYPTLNEEDIALLEHGGKRNIGIAAALSHYYAGQLGGGAYDTVKAEHWNDHYIKSDDFLLGPSEQTPILKEILYP